MDDILRSAVVAFVLPAAIALVGRWLLGRLLPAIGPSCGLATSFAAAYCAGMLVLRPWSDLLPSRHFHWPFYLALAGAAIGPLTSSADPKYGSTWRWQLLAAILAAILLVPAYKTLSPPRWVQVPLAAGYLFTLAAALAPLPRRVAPVMLVGLWSLSAITIAALTSAMVSLSYGLPAMMAAGALTGCWGTLWFAPREDAAAGLAVSYALVVGGWAYIGAIGSTPDLLGIMAAAMAPLSLWLLPRAQLPGAWRSLAGCALVILCLAAATTWVRLTLK